MLPVSNRTTWENYFKQSVIKDCNIEIYDNSGSLLINKDNIMSFSLTSRNSYICEEIPTEDCSFTIIGWNELTSSQQDYFLNTRNFIKINYIVENTATTKTRVLAIDDCKVNRKGTTAKVKASGLFRRFTFLDFFNYKRSNAETLQLQSIAEKHGLKIPYVDKSEVVSFGYDQSGLNVYTLSCGVEKPLYTPLSISGNFFENNIINDYEFSIDDKKSDLKIIGRKVGTETTLADQQQIVASYSYPVFYYSTTEIALTKISVAQYQSGSWVQETDIYPNQFDYYGLTGLATMFTSFFSRRRRFVIKGYPVEMDDVPINTNYYYIQTPYLESGSNELLEVENYTINYFENNHFIEFDCRIDPTFEPLDIISMTIDNTNYKVVLEEVAINFNGGFTGHIKGRIIENEPVLFAPVVSNVNISNQSFEVYNPNPVEVTMTIRFSAGSHDHTIPAHSAFYGNSDNAYYLYDSFYEKSRNNLTDDVYCYFTADGYENSDNSIILEEDI